MKTYLWLQVFKARMNRCTPWMASVFIHILALALVGGIVLSRYNNPRKQKENLGETPFKSAPAGISPPSAKPPLPKVHVKSVAPKTTEYYPKTLSVAHVSPVFNIPPRISLPEISPPNASVSLRKIDLDTSSLKINLSTDQKEDSIVVNSTGLSPILGSGESTIGSGPSTGGTGSEINFFGIRARSQRVALLVDVSLSMIEPGKGGREGFSRVKEELVRLVNRLPETTCFNVILFGESAFCLEKESLSLATLEIKQKVARWISPFYDEKIDPYLENTSTKDYQAYLSNAYSYLKTLYPDYQENLYQPSHEGTAKQGGTRVDLALLAAFEQDADTIFIISDGAPNIMDQKSSGTVKMWTSQETLQKINRWKQEVYQKHNHSFPRIHVVSYEADEAGDKFLQDLAGRNRGQYLRIGGFRMANINKQE